MFLKLDAPQGFEPRFAVPKTDVLPLDEGATKQTMLQLYMQANL